MFRRFERSCLGLLWREQRGEQKHVCTCHAFCLFSRCGFRCFFLSSCGGKMDSSSRLLLAGPDRRAKNTRTLLWTDCLGLLWRGCLGLLWRGQRGEQKYVYTRHAFCLFSLLRLSLFPSVIMGWKYGFIVSASNGGARQTCKKYAHTLMHRRTRQRVV